MKCSDHWHYAEADPACKFCGAVHDISELDCNTRELRERVGVLIAERDAAVADAQWQKERNDNNVAALTAERDAALERAERAERKWQKMWNEMHAIEVQSLKAGEEE